MSRPPRRASGPTGGAQRPWLAGLATAGLILVGALAVAVLAALWLYNAPGPRARHGASTTLVLPHGAHLAEIGADLQAAGVVGSAPLFVAAAQASGAARHIRAGEYAFPSRSSLREVIRRMRLGVIVHHRITLAEGLSSRQALDLLDRSDVLTGAAPLPPEGALLPETYEVTRGQSRASLLRRMMDDRDRLLATLWAHRQPGLPFVDAEQAVTLASIVEKETALASERPHVASVYINRLRQGVRLEADPTVIYGLTHGAGPLGHGLRASELAQASPYNTYQSAGLPPTPIDNPGRAALAAVLDPEQTSDLYFVADGSGGHAFSRTLAEHEKNVARWRAFERAEAEHQALSGAPLPGAAANGPTRPTPFKTFEHR